MNTDKERRFEKKDLTKHRRRHRLQGGKVEGADEHYTRFSVALRCKLQNSIALTCVLHSLRVNNDGFSFFFKEEDSQTHAHPVASHLLLCEMMELFFLVSPVCDAKEMRCHS